MLRHKPTRFSVATLVVAFTPLALAAQATGSYSLTGDEIAIYNIAGTVDVVAGSGSAVEVNVQADGADAGDLSVEVGRIRGMETLRVIYPADRIVYSDLRRGSNTNLRVRDDGTFFGEGSRGDRIRISGSGRGLEAWADLRISVPRGQMVSINLGVGEMTASNVDGDVRLRVASSPVEASDMSGRLDISTGSGRVNLDGANGTVSLQSGSGSIDVSRVAGNRLNVQTGSGSIDGADLEVDRLVVQTGSGGIELEGTAFTDGNLQTGSGSIRLDLLTDVEDLDVQTGSGGVTVYFNEDALGAELDLETGSGGIDFDVPINVRRFNRRSLTGSIGDGDGLIRIDTGSGSIRFIQR